MGNDTIASETNETENVHNETEYTEPINETSSESSLEKELIEAKERNLRILSEFENYKRRTNKEKEHLLKFANEQLLLAFLPLLDNVDRAIAAAETSDNIQSIKAGMTLLSKNLYHALEKQGVKQMEAKGSLFNPEFHEAIASMPAGAPEKVGTVLEEVEKGFMYYDKVLRYAKVITGE